MPERVIDYSVFEKSFPQSARPTLRHILRKAFFKHTLVHRFRNNYTTHSRTIR